jgi:hypothetical protein
VLGAFEPSYSYAPVRLLDDAVLGSPGQLVPVADLLGLNDPPTSLILGPSQQCVEDYPGIVLDPPNTQLINILRARTYSP